MLHVEIAAISGLVADRFNYDCNIESLTKLRVLLNPSLSCSLVIISRNVLFYL